MIHDFKAIKRLAKIINILYLPTALPCKIAEKSKNQRNIDLLIFHYIKEPVRYNSLKSENARPIYGVKKGKMHRYGAVLERHTGRQ